MKPSIRNRLFLGSALTLLLAACGQSHPAAEVDPYANGADYPWEYTAGQTLEPLGVNRGETSLSFVNILKARNGWGPIEVNRSNGEQAKGDGRPLTLGGQVYSTGLGMHANGEINFLSPLPLPSCARLTAQVGVDDEVGNRGSVVFQVYADGVRLFDSGVMTGSSATQTLNVDLGGKRDLRFVVTDAGDGKNYDHADWVNPTLSCPANSAATLSVDPGTLSIFHKHSATLKATFGNLTGPVDLRLEVEAGKTSGLQLQTTRVDLGAVGTATRDVVIAAPRLPTTFMSQQDPDPLTASYRLIASQNGQEVASTPVTITEKPLEVTASFDPATVSGRFGETRRVTIVLKVSPPLDKPVPVGLTFAPNGDSSFFSLSGPVGPAYGDGGTIRQDYNLTLNDLPDYIKAGRTAESQSFYVSAEDFAGYRLPIYGSKFAYINWNIIP